MFFSQFQNDSSWSTGVNNQKEKNPELGDLEAFFISIDTARDTFEQINDYCKDFHPQLKGLSVSFSFVQIFFNTN